MWARAPGRGPTGWAPRSQTGAAARGAVLRISSHTRSPERTAPSIAPYDVDAVSVPAQCRGRPARAAAGVENGPWGLAEFSEFQVMHRSKAADGLNVNTASLLS